MRLSGPPLGYGSIRALPLDGSNTLLHQGEVYARSVSAPATGKWLAMVRKHHAWKVTEPDVFLYGEDIMADYARERSIPVVPILFRGTLRSVREVRDFVTGAHAEPSALGGAREGVVIRHADGFPAVDFKRSVCKSVRVGYVQSDEHWSKRWRACRIARR